MPKKDQTQQQDDQIEAQLLETIGVLPNLGLFFVPEGAAIDIAENDRAHMIVIDAQQGPDAYSVRETVITAAGEGARAYRTEQRIDLATRLQLPPDYDAADLVGRTFLVPA